MTQSTKSRLIQVVNILMFIMSVFIKRKGTVIYTSTSALLVLKAVLQRVELYKKTYHLAVCIDHNCKHGLFVNYFNLQFYIFSQCSG